MRYSIRYSRKVESQLVSMFDFISARSSAATAQRFVDALVQKCDSRRDFPHRGMVRDEVSPGLRVIGFRRRATIAFRVSATSVTIVAILYRGADLRHALSSKGE